MSYHLCYAQSFAISNEMTNTLWISEANPISIAVEGIASSSIELFADEHDSVVIKKGTEAGHFSVTPNKRGFCTLTIKQRTNKGDKIIGATRFRITMPPAPNAFIAGKMTGIIPAAQFRVQLGLLIWVPNIDWYDPRKINKYTFSVFRNCREIFNHINDGPSFDAETKRIITQQVVPGDRVLFYDISTIDTRNGIIVDALNNVDLTITE